MSKWWEDPQYDRRDPMYFPAPSVGPVRCVALKTEAVFVQNNVGGQTLRLVNRHPHERLRIHVGPSAL